MIRQDWSTLKKLMFAKMAAGGAAAVEATATGNPLTFLTDLARPLKSLSIPFTPIQQGTGDPSPTNVRNILPWNGLTVKHGGANLLLTAETIFGKWINGSGVISNDGRGAITSKIKVESSNVYTLTYNGERPLSLAAVEYNENDTFVRRNYIDTDATGTDEITFSTSASTKTVVCEIYTRVGDMTETVLASMKWQFEKGTRTDYSDTVTETDISFPSPVYGGYVDVVTGEVWKTCGYLTFDETAGWTKAQDTTNKHRFYRSCQGIKYGQGVDTVKACNLFVPTKNADYTKDNSVQPARYDPNIYVVTSEYETVDELKALLAEHPMTISYELASPVLITTLTPQQISALVGKNTIWSDADGDMTAIYLKKG